MRILWAVLVVTGHFGCLAEPVNLFMIGNSYISSNDLLGMLKSMLHEYYNPVQAFKHTVGGHYLLLHLLDARGELLLFCPLMFALRVMSISCLPFFFM